MDKRPQSQPSCNQLVTIKTLGMFYYGVVYFANIQAQHLRETTSCWVAFKLIIRDN